MKERQTKPREHEPTRLARWWWGYVVAVAGTVLAALVRWALGWAAGHLPTYTTFYPVVLAASLIGGIRPGLLATALSVLTANLLFMEPVGTLGPATLGQAVGMGLFTLVNIGICILAGRFRRQSEALRESEARLQMAHQAAHIGAFEWNVQTGVNTWAPELEAMHGLKPGEFGRTEPAWEHLVQPEDRAKAVQAVERALRTFQPQEAEWRVTWPDGTVHCLVGRFQAFKDHAGKPLRLVGVNIDITRRKQAEEALRQSEEHFHSMADAIPQLAWIARADGYIFWFNRRCFEYTGATLEQLGGWGWEKVVHRRTLPRVLERWQRSIATGEPYDNLEAQLRGADGRFRPFLTRAVPLKDHEGRVVRWFGTSTDITEQKQAEAEIIALRDRLAADLAGMSRLHELSTRFVRQGDLQTLLEAILDAGIALTRADKGHVQLFDPASGKVDLMDQRGFNPAFVEYSSHIRPGVLATGLAMQTHQRVVVEDVTASPLFLADPRALQLVLEAGMRSVVSVPLLTRTGQLVGTVSILFAVRHQPSERDLRLLELLARQAADFIERTRAEQSLRAARQELAQANADLERKVEERTAKLREAIAELEHMSYSMVHDMRAPLRAMQSFAGIMQEECADCRHSPGRDYLDRIRESSNRLDRLITDALNYNKVVRENLPLTPVELGSLLRGMVRTYPNLQPPAAAIAIDVTDLVVLGNESLLTQCFGNLLDNAVKFVAPGVKPCVRIWAEPSTLSDQPATTIYIKDNGIGVPKEAQDRIFRMFQRMHRESEYPGTGIGLTIVRKAVERMKGQVSLDSEPGKGTCFRIELPRPAAVRGTERLQDAA